MSTLEQIKSLKPIKGIAVDGFCKGNPGYGGYRGVDIETGEILFQRNYPYCTNNVVEFIAICHAKGYSKNIYKSKDILFNCIYSDSEIAIQWAQSQKISTGMDLEQGNLAWNDVQKSLRFLSQEKKTVEVKKWITGVWGEIPADFGNKR